jgi:adenine deaminase
MERRRGSPARTASEMTSSSIVTAPFQTMSFLALSVIPKLKITDRGLVDVDRFEGVPLGAR